jgi:hypothetical protein
LHGVQDNSLGIGARVALLREAARPLWRRAHSDGSYLSASDVRVHFGLGDSNGRQRVLVVWPSGLAESFAGLEPDRTVDLRQSEGEAWEGPLP